MGSEMCIRDSKEAARVLAGVEGIAQCYLTEKDVVRHELVQRIVKAYADYEARKKPRVREERPVRPARPNPDKPALSHTFRRRLEGRK